ncbi:MAG TPA: hypothetical protein VGS19_35410 [Streptosporangiaceae bacterium]|nr:hypothetical protein [Streptosporangiaceae bacterium]
MRRTLTRPLFIAAVAALAMAAAPAVVSAAVSHGPKVKVGPNQPFAGLVNAKTSNAVIHVLCPGVSNTGHPLSGQTVGTALVLPPLPPNTGFTGTAATSIGVWLTWPPTVPPSPPAYIATFTSYGTMPIPTTITVPCSGSAQMLFLPAPGSPTVKAATVSLTFVSIAAQRRA